ncbi:MAG: hypothetical protein ACW967_09210 [Candidatus Hodarchaeales archaeon]|jgi:hypothetical protein
MQDLYFDENFFAIAIQTGIWLPSLIMALITTFNTIRTEGRVRKISIYFALFSWAISLTYISWTARALLYPALSNPSDGWFILWQFAYGPGVLSFFFLALWSLSLVNPQLLEDKSWIQLVLIIPWIIVALDLTILNNAQNVEIVTYANIQDIQPDIILTLFATLAVLLYTAIPILGFLRYLLASENKGTTNYRKILIIEIGLILFALGSLVDASKLPNIEAGLANNILFLSRSSMAIGIILMFFGLKLPKRFHKE